MAALALTVAIAIYYIDIIHRKYKTIFFIILTTDAFLSDPLIQNLYLCLHCDPYFCESREIRKYLLS